MSKNWARYVASSKPLGLNERVYDPFQSLHDQSAGPMAASCCVCRCSSPGTQILDGFSTVWPVGSPERRTATGGSSTNRLSSADPVPLRFLLRGLLRAKRVHAPAQARPNPGEPEIHSNGSPPRLPDRRACGRIGGGRARTRRTDCPSPQARPASCLAPMDGGAARSGLAGIAFVGSGGRANRLDIP